MRFLKAGRLDSGRSKRSLINMDGIGAKMKRWIIGIAIVEFVLLLMGSGYYLLLSQEDIAVPMEDMTLVRSVGGDTHSEAGGYVDGSYEGSSRSICTPALRLAGGSYEVTVRYERGNTAAPEACFSQAVSAEEEAYAVLCSPTTLQSGYTQFTYRFHVKPGNGSVTIVNGLQDDADEYLLVHGLSVRYLPLVSAARYAAGFLLTAIVLDGLGLLILRGRKRAWGRQERTVAAVLGLTVAVSCFPLFTNFMQEGDDIVFHLMRIEGLAQGLRSGAFPVRLQPGWMNNNGYPVSIMYGDLFLYIPAVFRVCGFTLQFCYKLYVALINIATAAVSYWCFSRMGGSSSKCARNKYVGLTVSVLYTLSVYRLSNVYIRSAVGEYTAMVFMPLVVYGLWRIYKEDPAADGYGRLWLAPVIGFTGIIECHALSVQMAGLFTVLACLLLWKKTFRKKTFLVLCKVVFYTALLNAWFLVPFLDYYLAEHMAAGSAGADYFQTRGINPAQLFLSTFRTVSGGNKDGNWINGRMALSIGLPFTFIFLMLLADWVKTGKAAACLEEKLSLGLSLLAMLMSTILFPYGLLFGGIDALSNLFGRIQFPWRFLGLATVLLAWLSCALLRRIMEQWKPGLCLALLAGLCLTAGIQGLNLQSKILNETPAYRIYEGYELPADGIGGGEYLLGGTDVAKLDRNYSSTESVEVVTFEQKYNRVKLQVRNLAQEAGAVELPLLAYKGYRAMDTADHGGMKLSRGNNNRISLEIPGGYEGTIAVAFHEPWYWRAAECVTLLSIGLFLFSRRRGRGTARRELSAESAV